METMNRVAQEYVRLVLALGEHSPDYVDAYYGPDEWREEAIRTSSSVEAILAAAEGLLQTLADEPYIGDDDLAGLRHEYLTKQISSVAAKARMLTGVGYSFDEESVALYDAVAPVLPVEHFQKAIGELSDLLPGRGPLHARYQALRSGFVVSSGHLDAVFSVAIDACRERTKAHISLPDNETFVVEYVTGKSWSGYNWYQGRYRSLIQVNTELPVYIDRALDLACHEGYPGHHAYNALLEHRLMRGRGWVEFAVYPLFSPQSLIAEGSANYGIEVAFPGDERTAFEREVLYPRAGLDPSRVEEYNRVQELVGRLDYAGNEAARRYIDKEFDAAQAVEWLETFALMPADRARQRVRFFDQYGSYVINYNLGRDLVREYVESHLEEDAPVAERWRRFSELLSSPRLPSGLLR